jgi:class 3 adenylate cyclase
MAELPSGTVTFLLTDIEGSTRLWDERPAAMRAAVARHDEMVAAAVAARGGVVVKSRGEGDSAFAAFSLVSDAVTAAADLQRALHVEAWPADAALRVRMALHTGEAELRDGDYYGAAVNRCARLRAAAHGGQVLLSQATHDLARDALPSGVDVLDLGEHRLKDLARTERIFQLVGPACLASSRRSTRSELGRTACPPRRHRYLAAIMRCTPSPTCSDGPTCAW